MTEYERKIVAQFERQFRACETLLGWARRNRPAGPPTADHQGDLMLRTYARSSKTYSATLRLAALGYGEQACMLSRSLFEDMIVAHWVKRTPAAPLKVERHRLHAVEKRRQAAYKHDRQDELDSLPPPPSRTELKALRRDFEGVQHWTGRSLDRLVREVEREWEDPEDRRLLWQVFDLGHPMNNLLLHHSALGVAAGVEDSPEGRKYNLGPSIVGVHDALGTAFFSYVNTASLVANEDQGRELGELYREHIEAFIRVTIVDTGVSDV